MHTAELAHETIELLWNNYLTLTEHVDLDSMPPEVLNEHIKQNPPVRPFRISAWLARQGFFIAAWNLWEYYARSLCKRLPVLVGRVQTARGAAWIVYRIRRVGIDAQETDRVDQFLGLPYYNSGSHMEPMIMRPATREMNAIKCPT